VLCGVFAATLYTGVKKKRCERDTPRAEGEESHAAFAQLVPPSPCDPYIITFSPCCMTDP